MESTKRPRSEQKSLAFMEISFQDYEEAAVYCPRRNFVGAIFEYCQRKKETPIFFVIRSPIGAEDLWAVELNVGGVRSIAIARTIKKARHRASKKMLDQLGLYAHTFVKEF